ncbi:hypothetical protein IJG98_03230 [Candidatus Saccharibacteria bacterium]|nr:hypothetical protein [Candidatus Saccharibacteria bacterium]
MKILGRIVVVVVGAVLSLFGAMAVSGLAFATDEDSDLCQNMSVPAELRKAAGCDVTDKVDTLVVKIVKWVLFAVGLLAVVMIIVGALRMTTSAGDAGAVAKAKNMIVYAVVGLVVAILAYAIVNFVMRNVG